MIRDEALAKARALSIERVAGLTNVVFINQIAAALLRAYSDGLACGIGYQYDCVEIKRIREEAARLERGE